ncbi:hypothetical protein SFA35_10845 [Pseudomonas sp. HR96]|uniref:hypothetical protein n=1 Tax=Pseudomonas sp. HR96 TaxID=1027966 RepID=UPI002A74DE61|nr:hypothetical protein [Pseudomonas sp. HR96]WPP01805.1 hypothetical protein SFA35_10845 [Pseudomonas sp. HR96]
MSNQTPAPNDDVPRTPAPADGERNDPAIDPQGEPGEATDTPEGNRYSPDDISPPSQDERTKGKPTDADIDVDGG